MRVSMLLVIVLMTGLGCGSTSGAKKEDRSNSGAVMKTVDGLTRTEIDMPGVLFIREDHGLGSYDAFRIPEASISYRRGSRKLPEDMEATFMASLEQSLIDAASEADIPIVQSEGDCVLQVAMGLTDVDIERAKSRSIGHMTLVMEFRDTTSNEPLLRYATRNTIKNEGSEEPRSELIGAAFDQMVDEMEISGALRAAGLSNGEIRPGCQGTLAKRGQGTAPAVSAR